MSHDFDATRLSLLLNDLRLPAIKQIWSSFAERDAPRKASTANQCLIVDTGKRKDLVMCGVGSAGFEALAATVSS